ncbi:MAG: hypothetical protein KG028_15485 [Actinobacteria bacterium]|jgi:hypothetical protein|nr:hypothetical protein [Actinomycetota bacterium]
MHAVFRRSLRLATIPLMISAVLVLAPGAALAAETTADATPASTECLARADVTSATFSHTFDATTGAGSITYHGTEPLCEAFVVRATTWRFQDAENPWPQDLVGFNDTTFTEPGTHPYATPARDCGQLDIYAGWSSDVAGQGGNGLAVPDVLTGPGIPYEPRFLHQHSSGPSPTYDVDNIDCMVDDGDDDTDGDGTDTDDTDGDGTDGDGTGDDGCVIGTEDDDCENVLPTAPIDQDDDTPAEGATPVGTTDPAPEAAPTDTSATDTEVLDVVLDAELARTGVSVPGAAALGGLMIGLGTWLLRRRTVAAPISG